MTTPVRSHFSDSWWNDSRVDDEHDSGVLGLWALIALLTLCPGVGILLTLLFD